MTDTTITFREDDRSPAELAAAGRRDLPVRELPASEQTGELRLPALSLSTIRLVPDWQRVATPEPVEQAYGELMAAVEEAERARVELAGCGGEEARLRDEDDAAALAAVRQGKRVPAPRSRTALERRRYDLAREAKALHQLASEARHRYDATVRAHLPAWEQALLDAVTRERDAAVAALEAGLAGTERFRVAVRAVGSVRDQLTRSRASRYQRRADVRSLTPRDPEWQHERHALRGLRDGLANAERLFAALMVERVQDSEPLPNTQV